MPPSLKCHIGIHTSPQSKTFKPCLYGSKPMIGIRLHEMPPAAYADTVRSKPCAWAVRHGRVETHAEDGKCQRSATCPQQACIVDVGEGQWPRVGKSSCFPYLKQPSAKRRHCPAGGLERCLLTSVHERNAHARREQRRRSVRGK